MNISIPLSLAKDAWQLIHDAKHPNWESKVVEAVKFGLMQLIQAVSVPVDPIEPPKEENKDVPPEAKEEPSQDAA